MRDVSYLFYVPDTFRLNGGVFGLLNSEGDFTVLTLHELAAHGSAIVTFDISVLLDDFACAKLKSPSFLIDVSDAVRACVGRSRDDGGERLWNFWSCVKKYFRSHAEYEKTRRLIYYRDAIESNADIASLLRTACISLRALWLDALSELEVSGESGRFFNVEVPIRQLFNYRQARGISVCRETVESKIDEAKKEKYTAYRAIADSIKVSPTGLNFRNVSQYLSGTDAAHLMDYSDGSILESNFRIAQHGSVFARNFISFIDSGRDVDVLARLLEREAVVHPHFSTIGTVTSRILVSNPALQQLRKKFRSVILPESGMRLAYLDYAQFEPGILASLSNDAGLISAYNSADVYASLSESLFGDASKRDLCKKIYLAFCYGMTVEKIGLLIAGVGSSPAVMDEARARVSAFFDKTPGLKNYKDRLEQSLLSDGFISSQSGNKRRRMSKGDLDSKEKRWAVSQAVQGTASLIFKDALIALCERFGNDSILLPMHDAVLMQFETDAWGGGVVEAELIMKNAFRARCGNVEPKVVVSDHF